MPAWDTCFWHQIPNISALHEILIYWSFHMFIIICLMDTEILLIIFYPVAWWFYCTYLDHSCLNIPRSHFLLKLYALFIGIRHINKNSLCLQKALGACKVCYAVLISPAEERVLQLMGPSSPGADFSMGLTSPGPSSLWGRLPRILAGALVAKVSLLYKWSHFESELTT